MRRSVKMSLTALAAAIMLTSVVSPTSARTFSKNNQNIRVTWASLEFAAEIATIRCRVTVEGSFHTRTVAKVARSLVGAVTRAIAAHPCTGGEAWADNGTEAEPLGTAPNRLPSHITYEGFTGTLPNITSIQRLSTRFSFVIASGGFCTGRYGSGTDRVTVSAVREAGGGITSVAPVEGRNTVSLVTMLGGFACPATARVRGTGTPTILNNTNRITITLI